MPCQKQTSDSPINGATKQLTFEQEGAVQGISDELLGRNPSKSYSGDPTRSITECQNQPERGQGAPGDTHVPPLGGRHRPDLV